MENVHVDGQLQVPVVDLRGPGIPHVGFGGAHVIKFVR